MLGLERANVRNDLIRQIALVLALLDVRAVEALDVTLIEHRRHRLDRLELIPDLLQLPRVEHTGRPRRGVAVFFEDVPAAEDNVVQIRQRNELVDLRARASLRLPRRMVPIWVREPIGRASPSGSVQRRRSWWWRRRRDPRARRQACRAGATSSGGVTIGHYIIPPVGEAWPDRRKCAVFCENLRLNVTR